MKNSKKKLLTVDQPAKQPFCWTDYIIDDYLIKCDQAGVKSKAKQMSYGQTLTISQIAALFTYSELKQMAPTLFKSNSGTDTSLASNTLGMQASYISLNSIPEIDTPESDEEFSDDSELSADFSQSDSSYEPG